MNNDVMTLESHQKLGNFNKIQCMGIKILQ